MLLGSGIDHFLDIVTPFIKFCYFHCVDVVVYFVNIFDRLHCFVIYIANVCDR